MLNTQTRAIERLVAHGMFEGAYTAGGMDGVEKLIEKLRRERGPASGQERERIDIHLSVLEETRGILSF